jgi:prepilin-type N-terminal cleavage/methylation domain-containing protein
MRALGETAVRTLMARLHQEPNEKEGRRLPVELIQRDSTAAPSPMKKAFTLIEMLVVIAIIALISSILIPSVSSALESARRATSMSNLRSIGQAIMVKQVDSGFDFPQMRNYSWQGPQDPGMEFPWMQDALSDALGEPEEDGTLPQVYRNPLVLSHRNPEWLLAPIHTHYRYNGISAPGRTPKKASQAVLLFETVWPDWPVEDFPYKPGTSRAGILVHYCDGHTEQMSAERYKELNPSAGESSQDPFYAEGWVE